MHDCVKWVFTGQQALKQAKEWKTVLELAQPKRQNAHDAPSCPLLKFITTEASKGGVIALTTTKIIRQRDIVSFPQATACRPTTYLCSGDQDIMIQHHFLQIKFIFS